ncbi:hypothetical protein X767_28050 [Mesorhizobium sp. LSJC264A00]|nr:hypothetical protein X767_28050 [Mesorhizobium sp. LSJC264A00]
MTTCLVSVPDAGHRILLPGEITPRSRLHAHGGNDDADTRLGRLAGSISGDCCSAGSHGPAALGNSETGDL